MTHKTNPVVAERSTIGAKLPTRETAIWFEFYGYTTTIAELARIFEISVHTLRERVKAGWPLESALIAGPREGWKITNIHQLQEQKWVSLAVEAKLSFVFDYKGAK